jgi:hypothetical protein
MIFTLRKILLLMLCQSVKAFALYNGNPSLPMMPEEGIFISKEYWLGVKVGYELDWVYERRLKMEGHHLTHCKKSVYRFETLGHFGVVTLNFNDRVELFTTLGTLSCELSHHPFSNIKISYHTDAHFAWGVGGRAILAYWGDLQVGVNAAYLQSTPSLSSLRMNEKSYSTHHTEFDFTQWQVGIGTSYRFPWVVPYIGVDYSNFRTRIEHLNSISAVIPSSHVTFKDTYPCGIFLGVGFSPHRAFNLNLEARFINENALSLSTDLKF